MTVDHGCSMAARIDLGHGDGGHCIISNEPCPRNCLLRQIERLKSDVRGEQNTNAVLRGEIDSLRARLDANPLKDQS